MGGRPGSLHLAKGRSMGKHARQSRSSKNDVTARMEWLHRVRNRVLAYELCQYLDVAAAIRPIPSHQWFKMKLPLGKTEATGSKLNR